MLVTCPGQAPSSSLAPHWWPGALMAWSVVSAARLFVRDSSVCRAIRRGSSEVREALGLHRGLTQTLSGTTWLPAWGLLTPPP